MSNFILFDIVELSALQLRIERWTVCLLNMSFSGGHLTTVNGCMYLNYLQSAEPPQCHFIKQYGKDARDGHH